MVDPLSLAAITAMLGAVGLGMGNEAGKQLSLLIGGLFRRGTRAPARPVDLDELARLLDERQRDDPAVARQLADVARLVSRTLTPAGIRATPQLPPGPRAFHDREEPLRRLRAEATRRADGRPRRVLLHGLEGMGTTAVALRFGARERGRFPDGQLYVDLEGEGTGRGLTAAAALRHGLRRLGVDPEEIAPGTAERTELFGRLLADRSLLLVLDHATSAAQVGPLLTAAPDVLTVVVARSRLTGVDAEPVAVAPLGDRDGRRLLADLLDERTLAGARELVPELLDRCGGRPYALRAAAARLAQGDRPGGGSPVIPGDPVRAVLDESYQSLEPAAARLYRLAFQWPWPAVRPGLAAAAAGLSEPEAERSLAELAERGLVEALPDGGHRCRPTVREHAALTAVRQDGVAGAARAVRRSVEWCLDFAARANKAALPERWWIAQALRDAPAGDYPSTGAALAALGAELGNLVQAVLAAEEFGLGDVACALCEAMWPAQLKDGRHEEVLPALRAGARVADEVCPGTRMAARMHVFLAFALIERREFDEADREVTATLEAETRAGHLRGRATAVETRGLLRLARWEFEAADELFAQADALLDGIGPDDEGAADLPRSRALLQRHRGRAQRGLAQRGRDTWAEAEERLEAALRFFRASNEPYNTARTLTDLAELRLFHDRPADALPLIDEALAALTEEGAHYHLAHLRALRERCLDAGDPGSP
ncbi:tetratricopeptide repeat protein [Streptomyces mayteni]